MIVHPEGGVDLDPDEALRLLKSGDEIHTFLNPGGMLVGADWSRHEATELIWKSSRRCLGGPMASDMGHGLVVFRGNDPVYMEHDADEWARIKAELVVQPLTP